MTKILEALAMADVFTLVRIERMLSEERLTYGSTLALVTAVLTPALESSLLRLKRHGAQIGLIYVGIEDPPARFADSPVYDVRSALEGLHYERVGEAGPWARTDRLYATARPPDPFDDVDLPSFVGADDADGALDQEPELATSSPSSVPSTMPSSMRSGAAQPDSPWSRPDRQS